jgi:anthranilate phosphoribosyltransferase
MKGETVEEITGCARAMRAAATRIETGGLPVVDTCGTGGDEKRTFNVSTVAALVAAGAGIPVAKHGNRSVSSSSGSADVLTALGVNLDVAPEVVSECIRKVGIGFLFAVKLHPAMKYAIGPRREVGQRTVFNILGPLTNPAGARRQLLGVFSEALVETLAGVLLRLGAEKAMVVHSADGLDELSVSDESFVAEVDGGEVTSWRLTPESVGLPRSPLEELIVEDVGEGAEAIRDVLAGRTGPRRDIALLNAGAAIYVGGKVNSVGEGVGAATDSIDSGSARRTLEGLVELTTRSAS